MTTVNKEPGERILTLGAKGKTMELEIPLPLELMHALERKIADKSGEAFRLEAELERKKEEVLTPIKDKIKTVKEEERALVDQRTRGVMTARIPVETRANTFRKEKWVVRLDTGEEVPDTRRALTDEDLQTLLPGVVVPGDNRPDAPVLNLFAQRPKPDTKPWTHRLASPYQDWSLSEEGGRDGSERLYMVTVGPDENPSRAWGPFGFHQVDGFLHTAGNPFKALSDVVLAGMAEVLGLESDGEQPAFKGRDFEKFMGALETALDARTAELQSQSLPSAPEGGLKLYEASGHPGWAAYVYEGQLFLRQPNVDRFEPPRSPKDKGPLEWDKTEERFDGVKGANVTSDWLTEHDKLLAEFDFLKKTRKIMEPVNELQLAANTKSATEPLAEEDGVELEQEEDENEVAAATAVETPSGQALSPGELAASAASEGQPDVSVLASKLTDNGRKLLKALVISGPNGSARLGSMTGCGKPGSALKHLQKDGLTACESQSAGEIWSITDLGLKVHEQATK